MQKNDIITIQIYDLSEKGAGIGRCGGMVVFVPNTVPGDRVKARIVKVKSSFCYGRLEKILTPSSSRIEPDCSCFLQCGGCTLRHMSYQAEMQWKHKKVSDCFSRIGKIPHEVEPMVGALRQERYRNKAQYRIAVKDGKYVYGFYAMHSHRIVPCLDCRLQPRVFKEIADTVISFLQERQISVYDEHTKVGLVRTLYLRRGDISGQIMVCLVCKDFAFPYASELVDRLCRCCPQVASVVINRNAEDTNVVLGNECKTLYGSDAIVDVLSNVKVALSPLSFYQVNHAQAERLYAIAGELAGMGDLLVDLYCGAGTIGLSMAKNFRRVIGVEVVEAAVNDARKNARMARQGNVQFYCMSAKAASEQFAQLGWQPDVVVLDPPRKGCEDGVIDSIVQMRPRRIVMISCNPATAARDTAQLVESEYCVERIVPIDLFPRTCHVETVVQLFRKTPDTYIDLKSIG